MGVSVRTLKPNLGIGRASTFRHFLNYFEIDDRTYGEFVADTILSADLALFLSYNQFFIKEFEKDYYADKTAMEIASKIRRDEGEINEYLQQRNYTLPLKNKPLRYISTYRIDGKLGGNYDFINLLREVSKIKLYPSSVKSVAA